MAHSIFASPRPIAMEEMACVLSANPLVYSSVPTVPQLCHDLRGWSKAEAKRRNVTISSTHPTHLQHVRWASVRLGKSDYAPILVAETDAQHPTPTLLGRFLGFTSHEPTFEIP